MDKAPSYIATNLDELFENSEPDIQTMIRGDEVNTATAILGRTYKIPVSSYIALENIISFLLIGALAPVDAVRAIKDMLALPEEEAFKLAQDLDKTILEKARISILNKSPKDMVTLTFDEGRSKDELRKEILDTTKREAVAETPKTEPQPPMPKMPQTSEGKGASTPGSRSQLLEQLRVLDTIPNDEEITERLKKIQEQIAVMTKEEDRGLDTTIPLQEFMPKDGNDGVVTPSKRAASYSRAPTKYNVDPYREVLAETK